MFRWSENCECDREKVAGKCSTAEDSTDRSIHRKCWHWNQSTAESCYMKRWWSCHSIASFQGKDVRPEVDRCIPATDPIDRFVNYRWRFRFLLIETSSCIRTQPTSFCLSLGFWRQRWLEQVATRNNHLPIRVNETSQPTQLCRSLPSAKTLIDVNVPYPSKST